MTLLQHVPILSMLIWAPVFGAVFVLMAEKYAGEKAARLMATLIALFVFFASLLLFSNFSSAKYAMQFSEHYAWIPYFQIYYDLGVDRISMPLVS